MTRKAEILFACLLGLSHTTAYGAVVGIDVESRQPVLGGRSFGLAGAYETISGRLHFAVDPENSANRIIADIDLAPTNSEGKVEFSSDFFLIKPIDASRGNGSLLFEVANRGRKSLLSFFNRAGSRSAAPSDADDFGDGFLLKEGFTLLWVGWQFDTPEQPGRMRMYVPMATDDGKPIHGLARADFVPLEHETDHSLADRNHMAYPVADEHAQQNVMTVRDAVEAERRVIPRSQWRFARVDNGDVVPDKTRVHLAGGFEPHRIYEIVYLAVDPYLVGLGPAGMRDAIAHLKYNGAEELGISRQDLRRALGFGISQSGRFLRTYLYYGFNRDESDHIVFDGVLSHVAGGGRGSFNHRFAQASRDAHPFLNMFFPTDIFPFTDIEQTDPETGATDGLMKRQGEGFVPKVFYTNSSYEYWGRAASLIHTSVDGRKDAALLDSTRVYSFAGTQHGPTRFPPKKLNGQQLSNPMDFRWSMRALLLAMDRWVAQDAAPPESQYGRIEGGTLVTPERLGFPRIPNVTTSTAIHKAYRADYGPEFVTRGIVTKEPPDIGLAYPMMISAVNADGNEVAGVQLPEHSVPLATYTGWNLFNAQSGPPHELSSMQGSYVPFPRTKAEAKASGDPRAAIEERYASRAEYVGLVTWAAIEQVELGYLLARDVPAIVRQAGRHWDHLMGPAMAN